MTDRIRAKILTKVPYAQIHRFKTAVERYAPFEVKWLQATVAFVSVIGDGVRPVSSVKVLVDVLGPADDQEELAACINEATVRALIHVGAEDLATTVASETVD